MKLMPIYVWLMMVAVAAAASSIVIPPSVVQHDTVLPGVHYSLPNGVETWNDSELVTNWHSVLIEGTNDYQAAIVRSNYFAMLVWNGKTNRVELDTKILTPAATPLRVVPVQIQFNIATNTWGWLNTIITTNFNCFVPCIK